MAKAAPAGKPTKGGKPVPTKGGKPIFPPKKGGKGC